MRTFGLFSHIIIIRGLIRSSISISHMITSCISSTIYLFLTKIITRKIISKEDILVMGYERHYWWWKSYNLIFIVLMRGIIFLFVHISFPTIDFVVDVVFKNISITFRIFFIFLFWCLRDLIGCVSLGGIFFVIENTCIDEWWPSESNNIT